MQALSHTLTASASQALERVRAVVGDTLISAAAVRRLARVSFLGALDTQRDATQRTTRFDHAIGVGALACDVAVSLQLGDHDRALLVSACVLHDIGHYPLSHSTERAFVQITKANHHRVAEGIVIEGRHDGGEIMRALAALNLDPAEVWAVVRGAAKRSDGLDGLLTAPINLDTLEGIPRTAATFRLPSPGIANLFHQHEGRAWLRRDAITACDEFWTLKDRVYRTVIERPSNILAEAELCRRVEGLTKPLPDWSVLDDAWLAAALDQPILSPSALADIDRNYAIVDNLTGSVAATRTLKRYWIDDQIEPTTLGLPIEDWPRRYRHERRPGYVVPRLPTPS